MLGGGGGGRGVILILKYIYIYFTSFSKAYYSVFFSIFIFLLLLNYIRRRAGGVFLSSILSLVWTCGCTVKKCVNNGDSNISFLLFNTHNVLKPSKYAFILISSTMPFYGGGARRLGLTFFLYMRNLFWTLVFNLFVWSLQFGLKFNVQGPKM